MKHLRILVNDCEKQGEMRDSVYETNYMHYATNKYSIGITRTFKHRIVQL